VTAASSAGSEADGDGGVPPIAIGGIAVAAVAGALVLLARRRRSGSDAMDVE
jgi:LPXTG-motif cell wall-anchored protein